MFETHDAWIWFGVALVLAALEIFLPSFFMLFAAFSAIVPLVLSLFKVGLAGQLFGFGLALGISLFLIRPLFIKRLKVGRPVPSRSERLIGTLGQVTQSIDPGIGPGRVVVMGEDWAAFAQEPIEIDSQVEIVGSDGIMLIVKKTAKKP